MKRIAVLLALLLLFSSVLPVYADSSEFGLEGQIAVASEKMVGNNTQEGNSPNRDDYPPLYAYSLNGHYYHGLGVYYTGVYSYYYFTDHGGSITLYVDTTSQVPISGAYITVELCHKGIFDSVVVDATRYAPADGTTYYTFTGLNSTRSYFFHFKSSHSPYEITTDFTVYGANS